MSESFERLQVLIATTLKVPPTRIKATTTQDELVAWDSLGHVNLMMALEQSFGLYIEVEDFEALNSVPAILEYIGRNVSR